MWSLGPYSHGYGFSSSHVLLWELDHKEGRASKNWCFWTVNLGKLREMVRDRGACCSPQEHEESDMTWWLNNNKVWSERMTLGRPLTSADSWPVSHSCWIRTLGVTQNPVFISYLVWFWVSVSLLKKKKLIHKPFEGSCGTLFTFVSIISKQHHTYSRDWIQLH